MLMTELSQAEQNRGEKKNKNKTLLLPKKPNRKPYFPDFKL